MATNRGGVAWRVSPQLTCTPTWERFREPTLPKLAYERLPRSQHRNGGIGAASGDRPEVEATPAPPAHLAVFESRPATSRRRQQPGRRSTSRRRPPPADAARAVVLGQGQTRPRPAVRHRCRLASATAPRAQRCRGGAVAAATAASTTERSAFAELAWRPRTHPWLTPRSRLSHRQLYPTTQRDERRRHGVQPPCRFDSSSTAGDITQLLLGERRRQA